MYNFRPFLIGWISIITFFVSSAFTSLGAQEVVTRAFDLPADSAEKTLKLFSEQSGRSLLMKTEAARGVRTNAVKGDFTPGEAISRMLVGTGLVATEDGTTKAFAVKKKAAEDKKGPSGRVSHRSTSGPRRFLYVQY